MGAANKWAHPKNELEKMKDQIQKPVWNRSISADVQWFWI